MLRRSLTSFFNDEFGTVTVDFLGITAILSALAIPVFGLVSSSMSNPLHTIQQSLESGHAVTGVVTITNALPPDLAGVEKGG